MKHDGDTLNEVTMGAAIRVFYYTGEYTGTLLPEWSALAARLNPLRRERLLKRSSEQQALEAAALRLQEVAMQAAGYGSFRLEDVDYPEAAGVTGKPIWRSGLADFSISHARSMAMIAVADTPVGVDVEFNRPIDPRIVKRVLREDAVPLRALSESNALERWTAVEAVMKAAGIGILHGREIEWRADGIRLRDKEWYVRPVQCGDDHVGHVCTTVSNAKIEVVRVDLL
jgi:hypothetical protein